MRYWAAPEQRVWGKLSQTAENPHKVLCSPLEWNGSLHFGLHGALQRKEKDVAIKNM